MASEVVVVAKVARVAVEVALVVALEMVEGMVATQEIRMIGGTKRYSNPFAACCRSP